MDNYPRFPLYIPSKGRSEYMTTSKHLSSMGVRHYIVVEQEDMGPYRKAVNDFGLLATPIELDMDFKRNYNLCDALGLSRSTGPGPARNFAWEHSKRNGFDYHWVMDDNIQGFYRLNRNLQNKCNSPSFWRAMEDFIQRYSNVTMAGPNYLMFAKRKQKIPPFITNTRIYSCNLIRNDYEKRWRGRYNEDTILSLDMLTAGYCTIQFNAFLQNKMGTQVQKGGNTGEFYHAEGTVRDGQRYADTGTYAKSKMMVNVYPQYSRLVHKFHRIHHHVDYSSFRKNKLIRRRDAEIRTDNSEYGMKLKKIR